MLKSFFPHLRNALLLMLALAIASPVMMAHAAHGGDGFQTPGHDHSATQHEAEHHQKGHAQMAHSSDSNPHPLTIASHFTDCAEDCAGCGHCQLPPQHGWRWHAQPLALTLSGTESTPENHPYRLERPPRTL